jgi:hypothetical protein
MKRKKISTGLKINNSRGVAKPTRFMGAYDDVLAGCFSTDVKAVVVVVIVATTARHSTTKRRAVNVNMRRFTEISCSIRSFVRMYILRITPK